MKVYGLSELGNAENVVDALFGLEMEEEFKCEETGESKVSTSKAKKLICNIQGGAGSNSQARDPVEIMDLYVSVCMHVCMEVGVYAFVHVSVFTCMCLYLYPL